MAIPTRDELLDALQRHAEAEQEWALYLRADKLAIILGTTTPKPDPVALFQACHDAWQDLYDLADRMPR